LFLVTSFSSFVAKFLKASELLSFKEELNESLNVNFNDTIGLLNVVHDVVVVVDVVEDVVEKKSGDRLYFLVF